MEKKSCLRQLLKKWGNLSIEEQEAIEKDVSYDSTISRDVEDAKADEIFTPVEEENTQAADGRPMASHEAVLPTEATVEESDQDVDPFPGE